MLEIHHSSREPEVEMFMRWKKLRVSNQIGISLLYLMLEMHHSSREPSKCLWGERRKFHYLKSYVTFRLCLLLPQATAERPAGVVCWVQSTPSTGAQVCGEDTDHTWLHTCRGHDQRHHRFVEWGLSPWRTIQGILGKVSLNPFTVLCYFGFILFCFVFVVFVMLFFGHKVVRLSLVVDSHD